MKCNCHPLSPFHWAHNPQPSMFLQDIAFRTKGTSGLTASQSASNVVEEQRKEGKMTGSIRNLGKLTREKEMALIAYKHFGTHTRAKPNVKPTLNKHEL